MRLVITENDFFVVYFKLFFYFERYFEFSPRLRHGILYFFLCPVPSRFLYVTGPQNSIAPRLNICDSPPFLELSVHVFLAAEIL
jgi:hypothetical protein